MAAAGDAGAAAVPVAVGAAFAAFAAAESMVTLMRLKLPTVRPASGPVRSAAGAPPRAPV